MNANRAENIIKYRTDNGPFKSRDELKKVKSLGPKTFEQCAGFIKIDPLTAKLKSNYNILDSTWVHPESYGVAHKIMKKLKLNSNEIGNEAFIACIKSFHEENQETMKKLERDFGVPKERVMQYNDSVDCCLFLIKFLNFFQIEVILEALSRELRKDYRDDSDIQPLFKQGVLKMSDLRTGSIVTGAISNKTTFGCFVDIGVEHDGLIHTSQLQGQNPNIGDRVNVRVTNVDEKTRRIQLRLENII